MLFAITCRDKADHQQVRMDNRPAHLDFIKSYADQIFAVGPMTSDDGASMIGSLLLMNFADRAAAEVFCASDPYAKAGLFETTTIDAWKKVLPAD